MNRFLLIVLMLQSSFTALAQNVGIGTTTPNSKLHIFGGTEATYSPGSGYLLLGDPGFRNLVFDHNEILARNNGQPYDLRLQSFGGKVGIGEPFPKTKLQISNGGLLIATAGPFTAGLPAIGILPQGSYFYWNDKSAAFRGGIFNAGFDTETMPQGSFAFGKDVISTGNYSFASGVKTKAVGYASTAMGDSSLATGSFSFASGFGDTAMGFASTAMGHSSIASGQISTAMGFRTTASGWYSTAMGYRTTASGWYSTAMGFGANASGEYSTSMGHYSDALGSSSTAMGIGTNASGSPSTAMGAYTTASGSHSTAIGYFSNATNSHSTAMGYATNASGLYSTAMGYNATASGSNSTATGYFTNASGSYSTAMGYFTTASDSSSTAMGYATKASGIFSTAMGRSSTASGDYSTSMGISTKAKGYATTAIGMYNDLILTADQTAVTPTTPLFIIGNGDSETDRSNAMVVLKNGNAGIGTNAPATKLHITNGADASLTTHGYLVTGQLTGPNLVIDNDEILARNSGGGAHLTLQSGTGAGTVIIGTAFSAALEKLTVFGNAGKTTGGSAWVIISDARLKKNIEPYKDGLQKLMKINPVSFNYNSLSGCDEAPVNVGVLAQDIQKIAPYMVKEATYKKTPDGKGYLTLDNSAMTYMLINAVKELNETVMRQAKEIEALKKRLPQPAVAQ